MGSVAERVADYISRDSVVQEAIRRGIVNHRALARWIIEYNDWDATEEAVVSALRRYAVDEDRSIFVRARQALDQIQLSLRSHVTILVLSKNGDLPNRLPRLFETVDLMRGEALRVIQGEKAVKVVVDDENRDEIREVVGPHNVEHEHLDVTEVHVLMPPESVDTPGALAVVLVELAVRGVNVLEVVSGLPELLLFVGEGDGLEAYRALKDLTSGPAETGGP